MALALETLEDTVRDWLQSQLTAPWTSVWEHQNAPKAGVQMLGLRRGSPYITNVGRDFQGDVNPTTLARPRNGTRELRLSLRGYGTGAIQILSNLCDHLDDETTIQTLYGGALAVVDVGPVQNLTHLYGPQFKEVGNVEIRLRTHNLREGADAETGVGYIQDVQLGVTTKDPAGASTTQNIEVGHPAP